MREPHLVGELDSGKVQEAAMLSGLGGWSFDTEITLIKFADSL